MYWDIRNTLLSGNNNQLTDRIFQFVYNSRCSLFTICVNYDSCGVKMLNKSSAIGLYMLIMFGSIRLSIDHCQLCWSVFTCFTDCCCSYMFSTYVLSRGIYELILNGCHYGMGAWEGHVVWSCLLVCVWQVSSKLYIPPDPIWLISS